MKKNGNFRCPHCGQKIEDLQMQQFAQNIRAQVEKEVFLHMKEKEKIIDDLRQKLSDAKRIAEQGSVQVAGEVQEQAIVEILQELNPHDEILQSKKGTNAADVMQVIKLQDGAVCGKIYYESKRTKSWSNDWIDKLKQDNLSAKADILVLVTNALPKGVERYGLVNDIWITRFEDFKELTMVLRYGMIKLHALSIVQKDRESKMEMLYRYLTSTEFKDTFQAIMEGFKNLQQSHQAEKLKMQSFWKEREKLLEQVLSNSIEFYGNLKGIAGSAVPVIKMLESPSSIN